MTEADEQKAIDFEVYKFRTRMDKLNKTHKFIFVKEVKVRINRPSDTKIVPWYLKLFGAK